MDGKRGETRHGHLQTWADCSSVLPYAGASLRGALECCQGSGPAAAWRQAQSGHATDIDEFALLAQLHRDRHAFFHRRKR